MIYYPYIRVPRSAWFTRVLLYWDDVATVVPEDWIQHPSSLGNYTRDLVRAGLVRQAFPGNADLDGLRRQFLAHFDALNETTAKRRRRRLKKGKVTRLHQNKMMDPLGIELETRGVAQGTVNETIRVDGLDTTATWWEVETDTAGEYMALLARRLGEAYADDPDEPYVPITDSEISLGRVMTGYQPRSRGADLSFRYEAKHAELRSVVLAEVFPGPYMPMSVDQIISFRLTFGDRLPAFRREIDRQVEALAVKQGVDYEEELRRIREEVEDDLVEVEESLRSMGVVGRMVRSDLVTLLRLLPPIDWAVTPAELLTKPSPPRLSRLAYAALARAHVLGETARKRRPTGRASSVVALDPADAIPLMDRT